jgi:hypothetical protein
MRFISALVILVAALRAEAAMVRVVAIEDGKTITIERGGVRERVRLAGVDITDEAKARELLRWTAIDAWVMLEAAEGGAFLVYRSPDALFLNRELVLRGFARPTLPSIQPDLRPPSRYLGEWNPPATSTQQKPAKASVNGRSSRAVNDRSSQRSSGTNRRSTAPPSRPSANRPKSGRSPASADR